MTHAFARQRLHEISNPSQIGEARRSAADMARAAGKDEAACNDVAIVVSELATNIVKHATRGALILGKAGADGNGFEVIAIDHGPGIADVDRCLEDGYSTAGTLGGGLGAVRRLADEFDIWSAASGTAIVARFGAIPAMPLRLGAICLPKEGETVCGDAWSVRREPHATSLLIVDGLGHGAEAADAACAAIAAFHDDDSRDPRATLEHVGERMHGTRGGAAAVATIPDSGKALSYCGVGNIGGRLESRGASRGLVSGHGIVGGPSRRPQLFEYPLEEDPLLILHSDGLQARWDLERYPGLRNRDCALVAAVLFRDYSRGRDDVTVVVAGLGRSSPDR
jgi:anti-sigma regulatory factor (Ser/Thr protein kinase)